MATKIRTLKRHFLRWSAQNRNKLSKLKLRSAYGEESIITRDVRREPENLTTIVAFDDDAPVGWAVYNNRTTQLMVYVRKPYRRMKIGQTLFRKAMKDPVIGNDYWVESWDRQSRAFFNKVDKTPGQNPTGKVYY